MSVLLHGCSMSHILLVCLDAYMRTITKFGINKRLEATLYNQCH
jgi:hypothetical protein